MINGDCLSLSFTADMWSVKNPVFCTMTYLPRKFRLVLVLLRTRIGIWVQMMRLRIADFGTKTPQNPTGSRGALWNM